MRWYWLVSIWVIFGSFLYWWTGLNPLPDGLQNEPIHMKNAFQLWTAAIEFDQWTLRHTAYYSPWPFGLHLSSWPGLLAMGPGRAALLTANLWHLGLLIWAMASLGRAFGARWAPLLVLLCPGTFGSMVRYEPNLANIAWVAAGLAFLVASRGLRSRRHVVGWGLCLGAGLMMDRLTVAFFLVPAVFPFLVGLDRRGWKNLGRGLLAALLLSVAYYREFCLKHLGELLPQLVQGEIDSAGTHTEISRGVVGLFYYPLALLDTQAGPVLGGLMLGCLISAVLGIRWRVEQGSSRQAKLVLLSSVIFPLIFFTLLSKKQVYYTLPLLAPLAVLAASRERFALVGVLGGLWCFGAQGLGVLPSGFPGSQWMPESFVSPRHVLARPPSRDDWPIDRVLEVLEDEVEPRVTASGDFTVLQNDSDHSGFTLLYSEEPRFAEKYLELFVSARFGGRYLRGLVEDHNGAYEDLNRAVRLVYIAEHVEGWPTADGLRQQLVEAAVALNRDPDSEFPIDYPDRVEDLGASFVEMGRFEGEGVDMVVFQREID